MLRIILFLQHIFSLRFPFSCPLRKPVYPYVHPPWLTLKQCRLVAMVSIILLASFGLKDKALRIGRCVIFKEKERLSRNIYATFLSCHQLFKVIAPSRSLVFDRHLLGSRGGRKSAQRQHLPRCLMFSSVACIF